MAQHDLTGDSDSRTCFLYPSPQIDMAKLPRVSVCIPTLNRADLLCRAIESVRRNTLQDFEIVVSDNASDDHTSAAVASFRDPRIRYLRHNHRVPIEANWTAAIAHARADLVMKLDDDDWIADTFLERTVEFLERYPQASSVYTAYRVHYPQGVTTDVVDRHYFTGGPLYDGLDYCRAILQHTHLPLNHKSASVFRADFAQCVDYFDRCITDVIFSMALAAQGPIGYIPEPLFQYVVHGREHEGGRLTQVADTYMRGLRNFFEIPIIKEKPKLWHLRDEVLRHHRILAPLYYVNLAFRDHGRRTALGVARHFVRQDKSLLYSPLFVCSCIALCLLPSRTVAALMGLYYRASWPKRLVNSLTRLGRAC